MTRENWINIAGIIIATIVGVANLFVGWLNTSRTLKAQADKIQPPQNAEATLINQAVSVKFAPPSIRLRRWVKVISRILNFIASYLFVQQALKTTPITRGEVVIMTICVGVIMTTFLLPIVFNIYDYFE